MKRDLDNLDLRGAFKPMPDECRNALMTAACSVKEEEPVKRVTFRAVLIAACTVNGIVYPDLVKRHGVFVYIAGDVRTGSRISLHGIKQKLSVGRLGNDLHFCCQCLLHDLHPFSNNILSCLLEKT